MPMTLNGSCRCGAIHFSLQSHTPYPYQRCYCSICRKTQGGGGYAINIMGVAASLRVTGGQAKGLFHAEIAADDGTLRRSPAERHFCVRCGTALWLFDERWSDLIHPFASAIDTPLPEAPESVHLMLKDRAPWVVPEIGRNDQIFDAYPEQSIEEWHRSRGLWIA